MTNPDTDSLDPAREEQRRWGLAIRQARTRCGFSQARAAERMNISTQAWQRYEAGDRRMTEFKLTKIAEALGLTYGELVEERGRLNAEGPGAAIMPFDRGRSWAPPSGVRPGLINELAGLLGPHADRVRLDTGALSPWAKSGELIIFDRERPPRQGEGCVVEPTEGPLQVWLFDDRGADGWKVYRTAPEREDQTFAEADVRGVYAVRFRGD